MSCFQTISTTWVVGSQYASVNTCVHPYIENALNLLVEKSTTSHDVNDVNATVTGCMQLTDSDVLYNRGACIDQNAHVLDSYISFCIDVIVPRKQVKCHPRHKPCVTQELK